MDGSLILTTQPRFPLILDASVLMQAHNAYYAFDICPGFWDSLSALCAQGRLMSIDRVLAEIREQHDALRRWANEQAPPAFFTSSTEPSVADAYREVMRWVNANPQFTPAARADFARKADGWLVAYGLAHGRTLVTQEVLRPDIQRRVPIPNVCRHFGVDYIDTFRMLRALQVEFHWRAA